MGGGCGVVAVTRATLDAAPQLTEAHTDGVQGEAG
jgi:hypothetical protein